MNNWLDPLFVLRFIKNFTFDINRLWRMNSQELLNYQNKLFLRMLKYSYNVHLYKNKYNEFNIKFKEIKGIEDISKLPIISKKDIQQNYPDKILPSNLRKFDAEFAVTSGSSGSPVGLFFEPILQIKYMSSWARILHAYNEKWIKTKITVLLDRGSFNNQYHQKILKKNKFNPSIINYQIPRFVKNVQLLDATENIKYVLEKINKFKPQFIAGHPGILKFIASLREKGIGNSFQPRYIASSGGLLDNYTKKYIENIYDTRVIDVYASTEGECTAFECPKGNYHVQSDIIFMEILDKNDNQVKSGESGKVVITRIYGRGTPIIRYSGLNDIAEFKDGTCDCGITSQLIQKIEGRVSDCIILPSGKIIPPYSFSSILVEVLTIFGMNKIKQFQIVQEDIDRIKFYIVENKNYNNDEISFIKLLNKIKNKYQEKLGKEVYIEFIQVSKIKKARKNQTYPPIVISNL
jgi:phenylacetate-CoA ligase